MILSGNQFTYASARLIAAALVLATTLAFTPGVVLAAGKDAHEDCAELRIKNLHAKLKITHALEEQWDQVALALREDAKTMDTLARARVEHARDMTAV